ncbi:MAG: hypothetical protein DMG39_22080 [Acidobacteria bacterium]|nr:MAG: hypothetical protein DMG39_22080 [Acidobacteriota bacterium]
MLRTAAAFGATGAATAASGVSGTASPFSPKALRASAGAALHLSILAGMSLAILLTQFKIAGIRTLASSVRDVRARFSASPSPAEASDFSLPAHRASRWQRRRRPPRRNRTLGRHPHPYPHGQRR